MVHLRLRRWLLFTAAATYVLIVLGAVVSATGAGMGCGPEWPFCNDRLIPSLETRETVLEYSHRVAAGTVALLAAGTLLASRRAGVSPAFRGIAGAVFGLILVQSLLGAVTVWLHLPPAVTLLHLITSQAILGLLVVGLVWAGSPGRGGGAGGAGIPAAAGTPDVPAGWGWGAVLSVLVTLVLGGAVKLYGAGLGCGVEFPLCWGGVFPDPGEGTMVLHWLHRLGAAISALVIMGFYWKARTRRERAPGVARASAWILFLLLLQVSLGAVAVWTRLDPWASVAHLGVATLLLASLLGTMARLGALPGPAAPFPRELPLRGSGYGMVGDV